MIFKVIQVLVDVTGIVGEAFILNQILNKCKIEFPLVVNYSLYNNSIIVYVSAPENSASIEMESAGPIHLASIVKEYCDKFNVPKQLVSSPSNTSKFGFVAKEETRASVLLTKFTLHVSEGMDDSYILEEINSNIGARMIQDFIILENFIQYFVHSEHSDDDELKELKVIDQDDANFSPLSLTPKELVQIYKNTMSDIKRTKQINEFKKNTPKYKDYILAALISGKTLDYVLNANANQLELLHHQAIVDSDDYIKLLDSKNDKRVSEMHKLVEIVEGLPLEVFSNPEHHLKNQQVQKMSEWLDIVSNDEVDEDIQKINEEVEALDEKNKELVDSYIGVRIPNDDITFCKDGTVHVFTDIGMIILLDTYILEFDPLSYEIQHESERNTSIIRRSDKVRNSWKTNHDELQHSYNNIDEELSKFAELAGDFSDIESDVKTIKSADQVKDLLKSIEQIVGVRTTMTEAVQGLDPDSSDIMVYPAPPIIAEELTSEELKEISSITQGNRHIESIEVQVDVISYNNFDKFAEEHHIIGWDLVTPSTLQVKSIEGVTPKEKIELFHKMMDELDAGWIHQSFDTRFVSNIIDIHNIIDSDLPAEFVRRVNKHNTFVKETISKIRASLVDMENDFNASLKDEVNLSIDWDNLTAFAVKKGKVEFRANKAKNVEYNKSLTANLIEIDSGTNEPTVYIPLHLLTDELSEKYVLGDEYYMDDVPDFIFYEVPVNGHVMIIEQTDI